MKRSTNPRRGTSTHLHLPWKSSTNKAVAEEKAAQAALHQLCTHHGIVINDHNHDALKIMSISCSAAQGLEQDQRTRTENGEETNEDPLARKSKAQKSVEENLSPILRHLANSSSTRKCTRRQHTNRLRKKQATKKQSRATRFSTVPLYHRNKSSRRIYLSALGRK